MNVEALVLIVVAGLAFCAALGGCIAYVKHRRPLEGVVLGGLLGPLGLILELKKPFAHRPMVDRGAWNSFQSVVSYQSDSALRQLTDGSSQSSGRSLPALSRRS